MLRQQWLIIHLPDQKYVFVQCISEAQTAGKVVYFATIDAVISSMKYQLPAIAV